MHALNLTAAAVISFLCYSPTRTCEPRSGALLSWFRMARWAWNLPRTLVAMITPAMRVGLVMAAESLYGPPSNPRRGLGSPEDFQRAEHRVFFEAAILRRWK